MAVGYTAPIRLKARDWCRTAAALLTVVQAQDMWAQDKTREHKKGDTHVLMISPNQDVDARQPGQAGLFAKTCVSKHALFRACVLTKVS